MSRLERLDQALVSRGLVASRSQGESYVRLGKVLLNGMVATDPGSRVREADRIALNEGEQYVSRAGLKLAGAAAALGVNFAGKIVLDVGSSTGGFTDYALQHGATRVIAVELGTHQLHPSLKGHARIDLHEKTDIRNFKPASVPDVVVMDVSFVSLRDILPYIAKISGPHTSIVAMVKPQFEAADSQLHGGIIKNDRIRRDILKEFELWTQRLFVIIGKSDSDVPGSKGNRERFYLLRTVS